MARWLALVLLLGCGQDDTKRPSSETVEPAGPEPNVAPPPPVLRRLTASQYANTVADLLGEELLLPTRLEPDEELEGLLSIGASTASLSPLGVEQYEDAAFDLAEQVLSAEYRANIVPCEPIGPIDDACAALTLEPLLRRAWRRTPTVEEVDRLVALAADAGDTLGDFYEGLEFPLGAILQSPHFLYRVELGDGQRLAGTELATRLSYFLWNTMPDDALLDAAESGVLATPEGLTEQVDRMLDDPRTRRGFRNFIDELLHLAELDHLTKDPDVFPAMRSDIGASAREESLATVEALVFDRDDDFRTWMTTRETFVDRNLAMLYAVSAPEREGFGPVTLPADGVRRGLLGQIGLLALHAHPVSSSATLRGIFVRETLLCQLIPPPPADVDTSIPEATPDAPTRRERVAAHLTDPTCAGCHQLVDPIGLGLENFDGLGMYRTHENGALIDASGQLDGDEYDDAWHLASALRDHPGFPACMAEMLYSYGVGHRPGMGEQDYTDWLDNRFAEVGWSMKTLLREIALSDAFAASSEVD
jgi:hypothetical protein